MCHLQGVKNQYTEKFVSDLSCCSKTISVLFSYHLKFTSDPINIHDYGGERSLRLDVFISDGMYGLRLKYVAVAQIRQPFCLNHNTLNAFGRARNSECVKMLACIF